MSLLHEIRRRRVFQVAAVYAIVAWFLAQIIDVVAEPLSLPEWFASVAIVLLMLGFPVAIVLAWAFDITPEGVVRTPADATSGALGSSTDALADTGTGVAAATTSRTTTATVPQRVLRNSVAVLPLENLSPNPEDAYFAAGIHEEILNYLTKIEDLKVIARCSVRRYENSTKSASEIGRELGVATVMEGGVRYAGNRVRVTAQLIDASTQEHLWSEMYERDLADVFAIQADIAQRIAEAAKAKFASADKAGIEALPRTASAEAHSLYLRSQALYGEGDTALSPTTPPGVRAAIQKHLDRALEIDPRFAHLYGLKALVHAASRIYDPIRAEGWPRLRADLDKAVQANAEKAVMLNENIGFPYFAIALNHQFNARPDQARAAYEQALELRPNDASILMWYATLNWLTKDFAEAIFLAQKAAVQTPSNPRALYFLGLVLNAAGAHGASADAHQRSIGLNPASIGPYLHRSMAHAALGHAAEALDGLRVVDERICTGSAHKPLIHLAYGYSCLRHRDECNRVMTTLQQAIGDQFVDPILGVWMHLAGGDNGRALRSLHNAVDNVDQRRDIFVRAFVMDNAWGDHALDRAEFAELREQLRYGS